MFGLNGRRGGHGRGHPHARHFARGFGGAAPFGRGFGGGPRGWGDDDGEGRGRRRRVFDGEELRLVLLKLIADSPRHGYDLIREIESLSGGAYAPSPGVVYPTLTLLDEMGWIAAADSEGPRKAFFATEAGTQQLAERAEEVDALIARLSKIAEMRSRGDAAPVRRAMHNLKAALMTRMHERTDDAAAEKALVHAITDILDDAARRIERL